jgi:hypothetical protein
MYPPSMYVGLAIAKTATTSEPIPFAIRTAQLMAASECAEPSTPTTIRVMPERFVAISDS